MNETKQAFTSSVEFQKDSKIQTIIAWSEGIVLNLDMNNES